MPIPAVSRQARIPPGEGGNLWHRTLFPEIGSRRVCRRLAQRPKVQPAATATVCALGAVKCRTWQGWQTITYLSSSKTEGRGNVLPCTQGHCYGGLAGGMSEAVNKLADFSGDRLRRKSRTAIDAQAPPAKGRTEERGGRECGRHTMLANLLVIQTVKMNVCGESVCAFSWCLRAQARNLR
jgi:hypothetical protein